MTASEHRNAANRTMWKGIVFFFIGLILGVFLYDAPPKTYQIAILMAWFSLAILHMIMCVIHEATADMLDAVTERDRHVNK